MSVSMEKLDALLVEGGMVEASLLVVGIRDGGGFVAVVGFHHFLDYIRDAIIGGIGQEWDSLRRELIEVSYFPGAFGSTIVAACEALAEKVNQIDDLDYRQMHPFLSALDDQALMGNSPRLSSGYKTPGHEFMSMSEYIETH